jgi:hypothetical protein
MVRLILYVKTRVTVLVKIKQAEINRKRKNPFFYVYMSSVLHVNYHRQRDVEFQDTRRESGIAQIFLSIRIDSVPL